MTARGGGRWRATRCALRLWGDEGGGTPPSPPSPTPRAALREAGPGSERPEAAGTVCQVPHRGLRGRASFPERQALAVLEFAHVP